MRLDGNFADSQFAADLFVQSSGNYKGHDLSLAKRQAVVAATKFARVSPLIECGLTSFKRVLDRAHEQFVANGFQENLDHANGSRLHGRGRVAASGDENNGH